MFRRKQASVPNAQDSTIRRSYLSPNELIHTPFGDEVTTVGEIFSCSARRYGNRTACSYREVTDVVEESKVVAKPDGGEEEKKWKYFTLSAPKPVSYTELDEQVTSITAGLIHFGFTNPSTPIAQRSRVSIYADTTLNWQLMAQASARLGHTITTSYTTLGEEGLRLSWEEPEVELCYCGEGQLEMVSRVVGSVERVRWIVYDGGVQLDQTLITKVSSVLEKRGGRLISLSELQATGRQHPAPAASYEIKPKPDDLFCIMYTSGSTGAPKGVLLSHGNVIAGVAGAIKLWGPLFTPKTDLLLAYLPLAHILEQFLEYTFYLLGIQIGYASVKTLLNDSVRNCLGDFSAYKPTLIGGVPAIYEMIRKGMMKKISDAGPAVGMVFSLAIRGKQTLPWPLSAIIDKVLFARVKEATGGRLRYMVCGGGALSKETQLFLSTVLAPMMQGYGLTETCGMTAITTPEFWQLGSCGVLGPSTECKLVDQPELGYLSSNNPPQGEVYIRGPNVFKGYFKREDLNKESFTEDGWFITGDIGQWEANGTLSIVDRVKNLIKLSNGEYLALDRVESIYKATDVIMMLCIAAPPGADRPVALIYPHEANLRSHLKSAGLQTDGTPATWMTDTGVKDYILSEMLKTATLGGLGKSEMIKDVIMTPEEWSPDNGMLTPAMKLARPTISKKYEEEIKACLRVTRH